MKKLYLCKKDYPRMPSMMMDFGETTKFYKGKYYWGEDKGDSIYMDWINDGYGTLDINSRKWTNRSGTHRFYKVHPKDPYLVHFSDYFYTDQELRKLKLKKIENA